MLILHYRWEKSHDKSFNDITCKIGFDGMSKQVLSYGKYMDKSDVIIDLVSCRGFDPKMKSNVDEANFHNIYRLEYRDTNQIKYF